MARSGEPTISEKEPFNLQSMYLKINESGYAL